MTKKGDKVIEFKGSANDPRTTTTVITGPKEPTKTGRCYESHKPLVLVDAADGKDAIVIHGGACSNPVPGLDIYVALDQWSSRDRYVYPWNPAPAEVRIHFPITDMNAPSDPEEFKKMVAWLDEQLRAGKKVHAGCIGGHGRTGTLFAALVKVMRGEDDAITYVRTHYCAKAVESTSQIDFLHKHFGITKQKGSKTGTVVWSSGKGGSQKSFWGGPTSSKRDSDDIEGWSDRNFGSTTGGSVSSTSGGYGKFAVSGPSRIIEHGEVAGGSVWGDALIDDAKGT